MNDQEYLAQAGIKDAETVTPEVPTSPEVTASPESTSAPKTAEEKAIEMFEISGQKYPVNTEFQILRNGKYEKIPYSNLVNSYRQASHYNEKYSQMKKEWEPKVKEYDQLKGFHDKYGQIQDWSEKNPQQWQALWELYQNKDKALLAHQAGAAPSPNAAAGNPNLQPFINEIATLKQELQGLKGIATEYQTARQKETEQKDTQYILGQRDEFKKEFPEIDMEEKDPDGVALWAKIIQWGLQNNYSDFTPAAHMFLKERIADTYSTRARNEAMKGLKNDHAQGIVKRSANPIKGQLPGATPGNIRKMSYGQLAEMAKASLGGITTITF